MYQVNVLLDEMVTSVSRLDEVGTSVSSVCLLDETGITPCTLCNSQRKQKGTQTFKEILPKSGFLYTEESSEMVRQHPNCWTWHAWLSFTLTAYEGPRSKVV